MSFDAQNGRMSRAAHQQKCAGGYESVFTADNDEMYSRFMTQQALQRLGQV